MEDSSGNSSTSTLVPSDKSAATTTPAQICSKEKITSNINAMADTGSQWSDLTVTEGPSLATTAPTESVKSSDTATPLRKAIEKGIEIRNEGKINLDTKIKLPIGPDDDQKSKKSLRDALRSRAQSRAETFSLPETSQVKPDHAEELLNEAVLMDRTLDEIQGLALKRPKDLLLGKSSV